MTSPSTRRHLPVRPSGEAEKRENALRNAFLNASAAIGYRPASVRSTMDKAASTEARRPWKGFAEPLRACAIDASQMDRATQDATEVLIVDAIIALMHYVLEPLDCRLVEHVTYLGVSKEVSEAVEAVTVAEFQPTPENIATAERESCEAARALQLHQGGMRRTHQYMRPLGASPAPMGIA
jgi:hypothetical protein